MHCFNSITVQLRPGSQYQTVAINQFQFHNGTIKTNVAIRFHSRLLSFNSITVQLRPIKYSKKTSNNKQVIQ